MIGKAKQQVNPKVAAVMILAVLILIQIVWWRGLVMKVTGPARGGGGGGSRGPGGPPSVVGRKDVNVETLSGAPEPGDTDGPGHAARFDSPLGLALDARGNLIVADSLNNRVRSITPDGHTSTVAGHDAGYADGSVATAKFNCPCGVAVGPDGAIYVADTGNNRIRRIKDAVVTTIAGGENRGLEGPGSKVTLKAPCAVTYVGGTTPVLYVADALDGRLCVVDLAGKIVAAWVVPGTPLGILAGAKTVVAASRGGLVIRGGKTLRNIPIDMQGETGNQTEFTLRHPVALCTAPDGWFVIDADQSAVFYVHGGSADVIAGISRGLLPTPSWRDADGERAKFGRVGGIVTDGHGHLYVSDTSNNSIRRITLPQMIQVKAPYDGSAGSTYRGNPWNRPEDRRRGPER